MNTKETFAVFAIATTVVMSMAFFFLVEILSQSKNGSAESKQVRNFVWKKAAGFLLLGIIPAVNAWFLFREGPVQLGLVAGTSRIWLWFIPAALFFITLNAFNSRKEDLRRLYPEMRLMRWDARMLGLSAAGWFLYLFAYEYLFRGILLFGCYEAFGLWPAVTINLALYSALHLPKGLKESAAAIPFGALICWFTLDSGSILPAVFLHFLQAFSCEVWCIIRNPEMKFEFKKIRS